MRTSTRYLRSIVVGGALAIGLHYVVPPGGLLARLLENAAGDILNRFDDFFVSRGTPRHPNQSGHAAPIVILDIDDQTYKDWGEPATTPRDKLAALSDLSLKSGAKAVVVDIDLSSQGPINAHDQLLKRVVEDELTEATSRRRAARIVLARRVVHDSRSQSWIRQPFIENDRPKSRPPLQAGTTTFIRDDDQVIRRWRLVERTCVEGRGDAVHSLQLLVAAVLFDAQDQVETARNALAESACNTGSATQMERQPIQLSSLLKIPLDDLSLTSRMRFSFDYVHHRNGDLAPVAGRLGQPTLVVMPAGLATQFQPEQAVQTLRGAIVLIGATHYDSKDFHQTPVGEMPGVFLVANAIMSLLDQGVMRSPDWLVRLPLESLLILILAAIFTTLSLRFALWVGLICVFVLVFPLALVLLRYGVWFDYVTPMLGPVIHQVFERRLHALEGH